MKNIVLLISNLEYGGAQRQVVELANNMDKSRFNVHVVSLSDYIPLADTLKIPAQNIHIIHKKHKFDFTVAWSLWKLVRKHRIDLINSYLFDAEITARLVKLLRRRTIVIGSERNTDYKLKKIQARAYRLTRGLVDHYIANSNAGAQFNSKLLSYPSSMYSVIHNGVDTERFQPRNKQQVQQKIGLAGDVFTIGVFASLKQQKNHPFLLRVAHQLKAQGKQIRYLFVGDMLYGGMHGSDDYAEGVKRQISELGLDEDIELLGNRDDVNEVYCACDCTVLPSLFEGTPNVVLESQACGVASIATNVSDNSIIIQDGKSGLVVELNNEPQLQQAISQLVDDRGLCAQMGEAARQNALDNFSTRKLAEKTEAVYSRFL